MRTKCSITNGEFDLPDKFNDIEEVYWSPSTRWEKRQSELRIEIYSYKGSVVDIFPAFYYLTQKGTELKNLFNAFPYIDRKELLNFVNDLLKKKILVNSIMTPAEIFYPQSYLFKNEYSQAIKYDADELNAFKHKHLNRCCFHNPVSKVTMETNVEFPSVITMRKSYRTFNKKKKIDNYTFKRLLSCFKQTSHNNEIKYYYASAGGLYPVDIYLYIKENRVQEIAKGLYYYNPVENSIHLINSECEIPKSIHYFTNQTIFNDSAASLFFIYNAEVTMPKYGGMGYVYSFIDTGLMVGLLTTIAETSDIGLCSIGEMNFKKIRKYFNLNKNQVLIHTVEFGLKPEEDLI